MAEQQKRLQALSEEYQKLEGGKRFRPSVQNWPAYPGSQSSKTMFKHGNVSNHNNKRIKPYKRFELGLWMVLNRAKGFRNLLA
jgi:hypothetical protein